MKTQIFQAVIALVLWIPGFAAAPVTGILNEELKSIPGLRDFTLTPDGSEAYFTAQSPLGEVAVIIMITKTRKGWNKPGIPAFSGKYSDLEPFLTSDGLTLYFASDRPLDASSDKPKDYDIWFVERSSLTSAWSSPTNLGPPVNSSDNEFYPSLTNSGNLYFTSNQAGTLGGDDIFFSSLGADGYSAPVSLGDSINTAGYDFNAFIAPDESYLIYTGYNWADGLGSGDLYISYNNPSTGWSRPRNLGSTVNSAQMDYCPTVHNGVLYFTSRRSAVQAPSNGFQNLKELLLELNKYENGQSRLYQTTIEEFIGTRR